MYLERFTIKNFRAIENLTLSFHKGLNILIGENNTGKTAIIDALRICLSYGDQRKDIYISSSDFHIARQSIVDEIKDIEFHLHFHIELEAEAGWFNDLLAIQEDGSQNIQLHFRYYLDENDRVKYRIWGGENEGQSISPEVLFLLYHVHLDALRNTEQYLRPIRGNRLGQLYSKMQIDPDRQKDWEKKNALAKNVRSAVDNDKDWVSHIEKGREKINEHLKETSFTHKVQSVDINFLPFDFNRLVDNLKIQVPVYENGLLGGDITKQRHFELNQNGLGYNNLIYTATVLGDLKQRKELEPESYIALLIEEPEAHLHPQLQNVFFNYLNKLNIEQGLQIFVTSHSPTITAKADLESVIVLQTIGDQIHSLPLINSGLTPDNRTYLHKFLDVTKSQLFFSNGVVLVEGISEALLLPVFGKMMGSDFDIEKAGIEVVNVGGVAFSHFANLFNNDDNSKNLKTRCALITDDDKEEETDEVESRAKNAIDLQKKNLKVFLSQKTFEFELFIAGNEKILLEVFKEMHPVAAGRIVSDTDIKKYGKNFLEKLIANKAKSELAHRLAIKLASDNAARTGFKIPVYIQDAIKYVITGK